MFLVLFPLASKFYFSQFAGVNEFQCQVLS